MAQMRKRLTPQPIKVRADIEVTCFNYEGIDAIQRALLAGQAVSSEDTTVRIKLIAPPLYVMTTSTLDKVAGLKSLNDAIEQIKFNIEKEGGQLTIKTAPKVLLLSALVLLRENSHHVANLCFTAAACTSIWYSAQIITRDDETELQKELARLEAENAEVNKLFALCCRIFAERYAFSMLALY